MIQEELESMFRKHRYQSRIKELNDNQKTSQHFLPNGKTSIIKPKE